MGISDCATSIETRDKSTHNFERPYIAIAECRHVLAAVPGAFVAREGVFCRSGVHRRILQGFRAVSRSKPTAGKEWPSRSVAYYGTERQRACRRVSQAVVALCGRRLLCSGAERSEVLAGRPFPGQRGRGRTRSLASAPLSARCSLRAVLLVPSWCVLLLVLWAAGQTFGGRSTIGDTVMNKRKPPRPPKPPDRVDPPAGVCPFDKRKWVSGHWRWVRDDQRWEWVRGHWSRKRDWHPRQRVVPCSANNMAPHRWRKRPAVRLSAPTTTGRGGGRGGRDKSCVPPSRPTGAVARRPQKRTGPFPCEHPPADWGRKDASLRQTEAGTTPTPPAPVGTEGAESETLL